MKPVVVTPALAWVIERLPYIAAGVFTVVVVYIFISYVAHIRVVEPPTPRQNKEHCVAYCFNADMYMVRIEHQEGTNLICICERRPE